jgi:gliding motility-associated-like protein
MKISEPEIVANVGSAIKLVTQNSSDIKQWRWSPAVGLDNATIANPTATVRESVTYTVVGANEGACVARSQITIKVTCDKSNVFVPNTFSPNYDGVNDVFFPRGKGIYRINSMRIFNRWGQQVFDKYQFDANDQSAGWDGTIKGKPAGADVYIYAIEVICNNNTILPLRGDITLIR